MYVEVNYKSESTNNPTVEIFKMNPGFTKKDILDRMENSRKTTGVGRRYVAHREVDEKNNDVAEWMQKHAPCMFGQWINWDLFRKKMETFDASGITPNQTDISDYVKAR